MICFVIITAHIAPTAHTQRTAPAASPEPFSAPPAPAAHTQRTASAVCFAQR